MFQQHCKRNFSSTEDLEKHVKNDHTNKDKDEVLRVETQSSSNRECCKCCMISCGQKPIRESLKVLLEDKTINEAFEEFRNENVDKKSWLEDINDGLAFKNNAFFHENPDAFTLQLYSDALELANPLGAGRLKHKIVQVFWSLCDIQRQHRIQIDNGQISKQLVDDLLVLEDTGIDLEKPVNCLCS